MGTTLRRKFTFGLAVVGAVGLIGANGLSSVFAAPPPTPSTVQAYLTTPDQAHLLEAQAPITLSTNGASTGTVVNLDASQRFQTIDGFGASLTDSSATVLARLTPAQRTAVLTKLFDPVNGAGLSFLRQPMGSSDMTLGDYSFDDVASGQVDPNLSKFSVAHDQTAILPQLQQIRSINGNVTVMASPWSPPAWMKSGDSMTGSGGGTLLPQYYDAYAQYFVKFVQAYGAAGIPVDLVTPQNEPLYPANYAGMSFSADQEAAFIPHLGAAFQAAGLSTKILDYDHNWDNTSYASTVLNSAAAQYVNGTAFHCYNGDVSAQSNVHNAFPSKSVYLTECSGGSWSPDFAGNLNWDMHNLVIGGTRNWAKSVVLWNLALDQNGGPVGPDPNSCNGCRGVVTIDSNSGAAQYNIEYYVLGQIAKVAKPGATRIASDSNPNGVETVAFQNTDGSYALVTHNTTSSAAPITVRLGNQSFTATLPAGAAESFIWSASATTTTTTTVAPTTTTSTTTTTVAPTTTIAPTTTTTAPKPTTTAPRPTTTAPRPTTTAPKPTTTAPRPTTTVPAPPAGTPGTLSRAGWVVSASSTPSDNHSGDVANNAIDGNINTRWSTGQAQGNGQWFQIDMRSVKSFNQVSLDAGPSNGDYPRQYQVYVSNDGQNWGNAVAGDSPNAQATSVIFATQHARYIRIVSNGNTGNWWSIAELNVNG